MGPTSLQPGPRWLTTNLYQLGALGDHPLQQKRAGPGKARPLCVTSGAGLQGFPGGGAEYRLTPAWPDGQDTEGRNPRVGAPQPHPSRDLKGQEGPGRVEART